jgi:2-keto-4-pentenoate hydratase
MTPPSAARSPQAVIADMADRLDAARRSGIPCAPVHGLLPAQDIGTAYAVQANLSRRRIAAGSRPVGWKIGLTSGAVQRQLGVDQPDFGVLFDDMGRESGESIDPGLLLQPRIEAEIAFVLSRDITEPPHSGAELADAVAYACPALEIVDSRISDWAITILDTVADNASSGLFVLGDQRRSLDGFVPALCEMTMTRDGEIVSRGTGADCLGDPLDAVAWLARAVVSVGRVLRAGDVVLSGALGPMVPVRPGDAFHAHISGLGHVDARFLKEGTAR